MFDFDHDEEVILGDDMILINGIVPDEEIGASIILITCKREEEDKLKDFINKEHGMVFVFEDEPSMDHFRRLFLGSKMYFDEGFNLADLVYIGRSTEKNIKSLKYISGISNFLDKKKAISFLNESSYIDIIKKINLKGVENIWILKDEEDREEIEGFYVT